MRTDIPRTSKATVDEEVTSLTADLVRIDSSDPGAYEARIERYVHDWLAPRVDACRDAQGRPLAHLWELEALPGRTCVRATIPSASDDPDRPAPSDLTICCHQDTVQLGEGWDDETPALGAVIRDGELWGRGSCDMKGGLACGMLAFAAALEAARQLGHAPERSLSLVCTVDEEDVMRGVEACIRAGWFDGRGWVLDTEPTDGYVRNSHKGRTWFELSFQGVTAHASTPWKGADAIAALAEAICHVRRRFSQLEADPVLGPATVTFGQVEGGYSPYVVPDRSRVWIDMRLVPPQDSAWARGVVDEAIAAAQRAVPGTHGSYVVTGDRPSIPANPASPLLAELTASVERCGYQTSTEVFTGYTDSAVVAGICGNANCMSYGPGSLEVAHKPNEHVPLADLARVRRVLCDLACHVVAR